MADEIIKLFEYIMGNPIVQDVVAAFAAIFTMCLITVISFIIVIFSYVLLGFRDKKR